jgi:hypothetical protein
MAERIRQETARHAGIDMGIGITNGRALICGTKAGRKVYSGLPSSLGPRSKS